MPSCAAQGKSSTEIEETLGHLGCSEEVVHRDNIGLLSLMERNLPANRAAPSDGALGAEEPAAPAPGLADAAQQGAPAARAPDADASGAAAAVGCAEPRSEEEGDHGGAAPQQGSADSGSAAAAASQEASATAAPTALAAVSERLAAIR